MSATAERYAKAIGSSDLEWQNDPAAIDTVAAAGMTREPLGTSLLRVRAEYDSISGMPGQRVMMFKLKSIVVVRDALALLATSRSHKSNQPLTPQEATEIAVKVLDLWLEPNCPMCDGRGSLGGYGTAFVICNSCSGTRRRRMFWPKAHESIAGTVGREIEIRVESAQRRMHRQLRNR